VSTRDNNNIIASYENVTVLSNYSKGDKINKKGNSDSNEAATSTCDVADSTDQEDDSEELQLYEIPNLEFGVTSNGRDADESHI
jgi:hypothetical protein